MILTFLFLPAMCRTCDEPSLFVPNDGSEYGKSFMVFSSRLIYFNPDFGFCFICFINPFMIFYHFPGVFLFFLPEIKCLLGRGFLVSFESSR